MELGVIVSVALERAAAGLLLSREDATIAPVGSIAVVSVSMSHVRSLSEHLNQLAS